ncbi:MAG: cold-shock protein [Candidatus Cyclobacteriaceae bacterium M3_2C_046]
MAKSKETFNKKEKEKKKLKKKKEKEERREARKASAKNTDFEDMLAYVDENGNISSTPPDPAKKKKIDPESIQIGVPKQDDTVEDPDEVHFGTVTFFNTSKGYGFIKDQKTQESVFVHVNGTIDEIGERDKVSFTLEMTAKGPNAVDVKLR